MNWLNLRSPSPLEVSSEILSITHCGFRVRVSKNETKFVKGRRTDPTGMPCLSAGWSKGSAAEAFPSRRATTSTTGAADFLCSRYQMARPAPTPAPRAPPRTKEPRERPLPAP